MNISSTMWSVLIAVGAILVAIGNINFNAARDRERGEVAGDKALSMLKIECGNNLRHIAEMRQAIANKQITFEDFETTAWSIVSSGGLLVQTQQETLGKVAEIYYLIEFANKQRSKLLELSAGIAAALQNSQALRDQQIVIIGNALDRLEPKLTELIARIK
jgi:hypothetical protein